MSTLAAARAGIVSSQELAAPQDSLLPLISSPRSPMPPAEPRVSSFVVTQVRRQMHPLEALPVPAALHLDFFRVSPALPQLRLTPVFSNRQSQTFTDPEGTRTFADTHSARRWSSAHAYAGASPRARIRRTTGLKTVPKIMPSVDDVSDFLLANDLGQHVPAFRTNKVDGRVLIKLTHSHLKKLGMHALGHRQTLVTHRELWFNQLKADHGDTRAVPRRPTAADVEKQIKISEAKVRELTRQLDKEAHRLSPDQGELSRIGGEIDKVEARTGIVSANARIEFQQSSALPPHPDDSVDVTLPASWMRRWNSFNSSGWNFLVERSNADFQPGVDELPPR